jgi:hypothetical protein
MTDGGYLQYPVEQLFFGEPEFADQAVYKNVEPKTYEGSWTGTFNNCQKFEFQISDVNGFRARVKYKSGATTSYQQVLISNDSFRSGDSKFLISNKAGLAVAKTVITDAATGSTTLLQGYAHQS